MRLPGVKFKPGVPLTAKATAAYYVMSQEDLGDAAIALATFGIPTALHTWAAKHPDFGPKLARQKAALNRVAVDIGAMADPTLSAKVGDMLDEVHRQRNIVESDIKTLQQALWSKKGELTTEGLVPNEGQILATRAAMIGRVDSMPDVAKLNRVHQDARYVFEHARESGMEPAALQKLHTEMLDTRNAWRRKRVEKFAENLDQPNILYPEDGSIMALNRLTQRRRDLKIDLEDDLTLVDLDEAAKLERIDKADTPEKMNALRDEFLAEEMKKVFGGRGKLTKKDYGDHVAQLDRMIEELTTQEGGLKSNAIKEYQTKLDEAQAKYDKRMKDCN